MDINEHTEHSNQVRDFWLKKLKRGPKVKRTVDPNLLTTEFFESRGFEVSRDSAAGLCVEIGGASYLIFYHQLRISDECFPDIETVQQLQEKFIEVTGKPADLDFWVHLNEIRRKIF